MVLLSLKVRALKEDSAFSRTNNQRKKRTGEQQEDSFKGVWRMYNIELSIPRQKSGHQKANKDRDKHSRWNGTVQFANTGSNWGNVCNIFIHQSANMLSATCLAPVADGLPSIWRRGWKPRRAHLSQVGGISAKCGGLLILHSVTH